MAVRGQKLRSADNGAELTVDAINHEKLDSPIKLSKEAKVEYERLCKVLIARATIGRVDLSVIAECARIKDLLNRAHKMCDLSLDAKNVSMVRQFTAQLRGLLRELGLTTTPSRNVVRTIAKSGAPAEAIAGMIKISETA
jgi:hypothetical protein